MYIVLNLNDVGRPLCCIVGGTYDKKVVSVSDKFSSNDDDDGNDEGVQTTEDSQ